jgi:hypothetical protein
MSHANKGGPLDLDKAGDRFPFKRDYDDADFADAG